MVVRNFNQRDKSGQIDWWQAQYCWYLDDGKFRRVTPDPVWTKWVIDPETLAVAKLRDLIKAG